MNKYLLFSFFGALAIIAVTVVFIGYGRGWRVNLENQAVSSTGLIVATSWPNGASIYVNGRFTSATNTTVTLAPATYDVKILKDGYFPWEKKLTVLGELVTKADATLFPSLPQLSPMTHNGVSGPLLSPSGQKIVYSVSSSSAELLPLPPGKLTKVGLWLLDMNSGRQLGPFGNGQGNFQIAADIAGFRFNKAALMWAADEKSLMATVSGQTYLLDTGKLNKPEQLVPLTSLEATQILADWEKETEAKEKEKLAGLPDLQAGRPEDIAKIATSAAKILWSGDDGKLAIFDKPDKTGLSKVRVFDRKKEVFIKPIGADLSLPLNAVFLPEEDFRHFVFEEKGAIKAVEVDGGNLTTLFAGKFSPGFFGLWPDGSRLLILTSLSGEPPQNFYSVNLR